MQVSSILKKARSILSEDGAWIKREWAYSRKEGKVVAVSDKNADAFCALGAIGHVDKDLNSNHGYIAAIRGSKAAKILAKVVIGVADGDIIPGWNDTGNRTKEEVLAKFDEAIKLAECLEENDPERLEKL